MKKIKILQVAYGFEGGIGRLLVDYCSRLKQDFEFEFLISYYDHGYFESILRSEGFIIHHTQLGMPKEQKEQLLENIFSKNQYDIVHLHGLCDYVLLRIAKKHGVRIRIVHSHNALDTLSDKTKPYRMVRGLYNKFRNKLLITDKWACGSLAAYSMWGKGAIESNDVYIMKNAIDVSLFAYSEEKRKSIRQILNIENKFVVGNVGRLTEQKNHRFLLNVFAELKKIKDNAILLIIGEGELQSELERIAIKLNIQDSVIFMGNRSDVSELLNVMDVFVLPSIFEGLPVVMIEAQANGLKCIISDTVTKECSFFEENVYLSLSDNYKSWAKQLAIPKDMNRSLGVKVIKNNGFEINSAAKELCEYYESLV